MFKNIIDKIKIIFRKKSDNGWTDISENIPNWVKEKIREIQHDKSLPNILFKNKYWIIQGRYSIYRATFINKDKYSTVHRTRKRKGIPAWIQYVDRKKLGRLDTKAKRITVDQILKNSNFGSK